jgi:hypothetical protein
LYRFWPRSIDPSFLKARETEERELLGTFFALADSCAASSNDTSGVEVASFAFPGMGCEGIIFMSSTPSTAGGS